MKPKLMNSNLAMYNKSQLSTFIIVGLLLLVIVSLAVYFIKIRTLTPGIPQGTQPIKVYVEKCLSDVAVPGIYLLASQGGYIYTPHPALSIEETKGISTQIAYGNYNGNSTLATKEIIEQQLGTYVNYAVLDCINDFEVFREQGWNISYISYTHRLSTKAVVESDHVTLRLEFPVLANGVEFREFSAEVPTMLGYLHETAKYINSATLTDPNKIDLTKLSELGEVKIIPVTEQTMVYSIANGDLIFMFAVKPALNKPPKLNIKNAFDLKLGEEFRYMIPYENDATDSTFSAVSFSSDTSMFDIVNGTISFVPQITGDFPVKITITNSLQQSDSKTVRFVVHE